MQKLQENPQQELAKIAVEFYKKYKEDEELFKLIKSKEFAYVVSKLSSLVNFKPNKLKIRTYKDREEKEKVMEDSHIMSQYRFVILSDRTEIIEIIDENKVVAYALLSYEDEIDFGKYAFLHFLQFIDDEYKKVYKNFEKLIIQKLKNTAVLYFDRTISFQTNRNEDKVILEEIKNMGYICIWKNCKVELNINGYANLSMKVKIEKMDDIDEDYTLIGRIIPKKFENRSNVYKGILDDGQFFVNVIKNNGKAFISIYVYNGKLEDQNYIKKVYEETFKALTEHNISKIVTFVSPENIIILQDVININVVQSIYWLRKQL